MADPLAYFLTWTTFGKWLHGDPRRSIDRFHNSRMQVPLPPDAQLRQSMESALRHPSRVLDSRSRALVEQVIRKHCDVRQWDLKAINVRSNHVHLVLRCPDRTPPETAMNQFKAWATRRLREAGIVSDHEKVWTEHGSTRWINHQEGLDAAIRYVHDWQD